MPCHHVVTADVAMARKRSRQPISFFVFHFLFIFVSTKGTIHAGTLTGRLGAHGLVAVLPLEEVQGTVHDAIYNPTWGLKSKLRGTKRARQALTI